MYKYCIIIKSYKNAFIPDSTIRSKTSKIKNSSEPYAAKRLIDAAVKSLQNESIPSERHLVKQSSYFIGAIKEPPFGNK